MGILSLSDPKIKVLGALTIGGGLVLVYQGAKYYGYNVGGTDRRMQMAANEADLLYEKYKQMQKPNGIDRS